MDSFAAQCTTASKSYNHDCAARVFNSLVRMWLLGLCGPEDAVLGVSQLLFVLEEA